MLPFLVKTHFLMNSKAEMSGIRCNTRLHISRTMFDPMNIMQTQVACACVAVDFTVAILQNLPLPSLFFVFLFFVGKTQTSKQIGKNEWKIKRNRRKKIEKNEKTKREKDTHEKWTTKTKRIRSRIKRTWFFWHEQIRNDRLPPCLHRYAEWFGGDSCLCERPSLCISNYTAYLHM